MLDQSWTMFAKREASYKEEPPPTLAVTDAMYVWNLRPNPFNGGTVEREGYRGGLYGARPQVPVNRHQQLTFSTEMTGIASVTTPDVPPIGELLVGCGMTETLTPATSAAYALEGDPQNHGSFYAIANNDSAGNNQYAFRGTRGTYVLQVPENNFMTMDFTCMASYVAPAQVAAPGAPDFSKWLDPTPVSEIDTPTYTLDGSTPEHVSSSFDFGANVVAKDRPNVGENIIISDIVGSGTLTALHGGLAVDNWAQKANDATQMVLNIVQVNSVAGWRITINFPTVQIVNYAIGESNGETTEELQLALIGSAGSPAMTITFDEAP